MPNASPNALPQGAYLKDISAHYNQLTVPRNLRHGMPLPAEVWARVVVEEGALKLFLDDDGQPTMAEPDSAALIPGGATFRVEDSGSPLRFYLEYYHVPTMDDGAELAGSLSRTRSRKSGSGR